MFRQIDEYELGMSEEEEVGLFVVSFAFVDTGLTKAWCQFQPFNYYGVNINTPP